MPESRSRAPALAFRVAIVAAFVRLRFSVTFVCGSKARLLSMAYVMNIFRIMKAKSVVGFVKSFSHWRSTGQSLIRVSPGCITHAVLVRGNCKERPIGEENTLRTPANLDECARADHAMRTNRTLMSLEVLECLHSHRRA